MSAKIPIGWTACVEGEPVPYEVPLERLGEDGERNYCVYGKDLRWGKKLVAYRIVEAERPPLEYPAEPVLTDGEANRLAGEVLNRYRWYEFIEPSFCVGLRDAIREEALKITREAERCTLAS